MIELYENIVINIRLPKRKILIISNLVNLFVNFSLQYVLQHYPCKIEQNYGLQFLSDIPCY